MSIFDALNFRKHEEEELGPDEEWEEFYEEVTEEPSSEAGKAEEDPGYERKEWKGFPLFQCKRCPFNHVSADGDEATIKAHVWKFHLMPENLAENAARTAIRRPIEAELYDASGRLIDERDATPEEVATESLLDFEPPKTLNG